MCRLWCCGLLNRKKSSALFSLAKRNSIFKREICSRCTEYGVFSLSLSLEFARTYLGTDMYYSMCVISVRTNFRFKKKNAIDAENVQKRLQND